MAKNLSQDISGWPASVGRQPGQKIRSSCPSVFPLFKSTRQYTNRNSCEASLRPVRQSPPISTNHTPRSGVSLIPPCVRIVVSLENKCLELLFPHQNGGSKIRYQAKNELFSNIFDILAGSDPKKDTRQSQIPVWCTTGYQFGQGLIEIYGWFLVGVMKVFGAAVTV